MNSRDSFRPVTPPSSPTMRESISPLESEAANTSPIGQASAKGLKRQEKVYKIIVDTAKGTSKQTKDLRISPVEIQMETTTQDKRLEQVETQLNKLAGSDIATLVSEIGDTLDPIAANALKLPPGVKAEAGWWTKAVSSVKLKGLKSLLGTFSTPHLVKRIVTTIACNIVNQAFTQNITETSSDKVKCHSLQSLGAFAFKKAGAELKKIADASARTYVAAQSKSTASKSHHRSIDAELKLALESETQTIDQATEALYQFILPNGSEDLHQNKQIARLMGMYLKRKIKQSLTDYSDYKKREMDEVLKSGQPEIQKAKETAKLYIDTAFELALNEKQIKGYAENASKGLNPSGKASKEQVEWLTGQFGVIAAEAKTNPIFHEVLAPFLLRLQEKGNVLENTISFAYQFLNDRAPRLNAAVAEDQANPPKEREVSALSKQFIPFVEELLEKMGLENGNWPIPLILEKAIKRRVIPLIPEQLAKNYDKWKLPAFRETGFHIQSTESLVKSYVENEALHKKLGSNVIENCHKLVEESTPLLLEQARQVLKLPEGVSIDSPHMRVIARSMLLQVLLNAAANSGEGIRDPEKIFQEITEKVATIIKTFMETEGRRDKLNDRLKSAGKLLAEKKDLDDLVPKMGELTGKQLERLKKIEEELVQIQSECTLLFKPLAIELRNFVSISEGAFPLFSAIPFAKQLQSQWPDLWDTQVSKFLASQAITKAALPWAGMRETLETHKAPYQQDVAAKEACHSVALEVSKSVNIYIETNQQELGKSAFNQTVEMLEKQLGKKSPIVAFLKEHPESAQQFFVQALVGVTGDPLFNKILGKEILNYTEFFALPALSRMQGLNKEGEAPFFASLASKMAAQTQTHLHQLNEKRAAELTQGSVGTVKTAPVTKETLEERQKRSFAKAATVALAMTGIKHPSDLGLPSPVCDKIFKLLEEKLAAQFEKTFLRMTDPKFIKNKVYENIVEKSGNTKGSPQEDSELIDPELVNTLSAEMVAFLPSTWVKTFLGQGFILETVSGKATKSASKAIQKHQDLHKLMLKQMKELDLSKKTDMPEKSTVDISREMEARVRTETVDWMAKKMNQLWGETIQEDSSTLSSNEQQVMQNVGEEVNAGWLASTFAFVSGTVTSVIVNARDIVVAKGAQMVADDAEEIMMHLDFEEHKNLFITFFDQAIQLIEKDLEVN